MKQDGHKILIIKLGYSETLIPEVRQTCSLGDVFRTTAVLHLFKNDHVTWLTDEAAVPLLEDNPYINRVIPFDLLSVLQLQSERFDKVINLEKVPGICAMVDQIKAWGHYGFRFDAETGEAEAFDRAYEALAIATRDDLKKLHEKSWLEVLFEMLGAKWQGESYILGYKPKTEVAYDLGFNSHVGSLMPVKAWPTACWQALEARVGDKYTVTHQQHLDDLRGYMDWIHSCRLLITSDSLGIFLGLVLGKKVLALFGPTSPSEHLAHPNLRVLVPPLDRECMPCFKSRCEYDDVCMEHISPEAVLAAIDDWGVV